jgi:hypothetical protein
MSILTTASWRGLLNCYLVLCVLSVFFCKPSVTLFGGGGGGGGKPTLITDDLILICFKSKKIRTGVD